MFQDPAPPLALRRAAVVAAVRACLGTRFRPQGRTPGLALDCIGVALVAAGAAGLGDLAVPRYALGGDHEAEIEPLLARFGCTAVAVAQPADLILAAPSRRQRHLAVATPAGIVHAHAGIGCVVEAPVPAEWRVLGAWQLPGVD